MWLTTVLPISSDDATAGNWLDKEILCVWGADIVQEALEGVMLVKTQEVAARVM
ncbi:hypothetical protein STRIP9103_03624 [Streptomyces ipomoeae 91-03]|uniref:Uncharacterized protein n=1 Tax=Streptomyces ipomoeae 91-03 TaxID=698759 RepID=L1KRH7_9ACTN|nr:hypothetical protein STRIP9103_03624 [Streptomyces ipomoeae 91-03]